MKKEPFRPVLDSDPPDAHPWAEVGAQVVDGQRVPPEAVLIPL